MNRPDIEAIKERLHKAIGENEQYMWIAYGESVYYAETNENCVTDACTYEMAEFIAHSRPDILELIAYIEELESENRWIPVEERLPENDDPFVIVRTKTGEIIPGYLDTDLEDIPVLVHVNGIPILDAIAWRPLPYGVKNDAR